MQCVEGAFIYAASDLNNYLECKRLTELDGLVALKRLAPPGGEDDEQVALIKRKGDEHERRYLERLQSQHGGAVVCFPRAGSGIEAYRAAERRTLDAMRSGARIIYQATFFDGTFLGHADFLRRVEIPSELGSWSYEVIDTKLALSTKAYFLVQICNYSEHVGRLQGRMPERAYVVLGTGEERAYRLHDYLAYYRHLKARFLEFASGNALAAEPAPRQYPLECKHCGICPWNQPCEQQRIDDDHLSLVAWMRRDQLQKLEAGGITTVTALANAADDARPEGMNPQSFAKLRRQAKLQVRGRSEGPVYELLRHDPRIGFGLLPAPAPGDVFFDMEGDPMYEPGRGLEYLFGCWMPDEEPHFRAFWALDRAEEKRQFEAFVDFITQRRQRYPAMHVYHYADYEKAALRRLAQQHNTRIDQVDDLLRGEVLVDLFAVVRQAIAISEDSYSIKRFEKFYGFARTTDVKKGDQSIVMFERWCAEKDPAILHDIENYNNDDCYSTYLLLRWLLERCAEAIAAFGADLPLRPVKLPDEPCHAEFFSGCNACKKRQAAEREDARRGDLERALLQGVLAPQSEAEYRLMPGDERARYLLGNLLAYHRREAKPAWWEYYDRCENVDRLLEFDKSALAELRLLDVPPFKLGPRDRHHVYTYAFPDQRHKMEPGDAHDPLAKKSAGTIVAIDDESNILQLKRGGSSDDAEALTALIPGGPLSTDAQQAALTRIAQSFVDGHLQSAHRAAYDLLSSRNPRMHGASGSVQPARVTAQSVSSAVQSLDASYLFIQGPPGSGKSTIGSQVICDLLHAGKRVGVLSTGHKAIHHLLHKVETCMQERRRSFRGLYKHSQGNAGSQYVSQLATPFIESVDDNDAFGNRGYDLAGGTAWLFSRAELAGTFDYLFIDEAGQVSLADALAVSACAKNVVLLGDPSQLAQVSRGIHALHANDSVLQHLLGEEQTVPPERGIFLDVSYRMHPDICSFVSEAMYEGRLAADPKTLNHRVTSAGLSGSGLRYVPIEHTGNSSSSTEEAGRIAGEIALLLRGTLADDDGVERPVRSSDIIVVTPYNAQRRLIGKTLRNAGIDVRVGTVDKFQGQEAAVVFYSMATSSGEDIPRDLEFLFEQNRFNVAVSRARALTVLVCSPRLLDISCRTAEQMALVNLLCAFSEAAGESAFTAVA